MPPLNGEMIGCERTAFGRQGPLQMMEKLPQIRPRLRFARFRPQEKSQPFPRLGRIAVEDQIRDEGLQTVRVDGRHGASRDGDPQIAEQADLCTHRLCILRFVPVFERPMPSLRLGPAGGKFHSRSSGA